MVQRVAEALYDLKDEFICWPQDCSNLAERFFKVGGFPSVAGCLDGTHVQVVPPKEVQVDFINRHHSYSLNMLGVAGPDLDFFTRIPIMAVVAMTATSCVLVLCGNLLKSRIIGHSQV